MATIATQFCVAVRNQAGSLASLCAALSAGGVNIEAIFVSDDEEYCWVNFIAQPESAVEAVLGAGGFHFFTESVLTLQLDNQPGALEKVAASLADNEVNINYVYGGGLHGSPFTLVLNVSDVERASQVLTLEAHQSSPVRAYE